jgi:hypothetical protein
MFWPLQFIFFSSYFVWVIMNLYFNILSKQAEIIKIQLPVLVRQASDMSVITKIVVCVISMIGKLLFTQITSDMKYFQIAEG